MSDKSLPELLRNTAENIHSRGPAIASSHLRSGADRIEHLQSMLDAAKMRESARDAVALPHECARWKCTSPGDCRDIEITLYDTAVRIGLADGRVDPRTLPSQVFVDHFHAGRGTERDAAISAAQSMIEGYADAVKVRDATIAERDQTIAGLRSALAVEKHLANECAILVQERDVLIASLRAGMQAGLTFSLPRETNPPASGYHDAIVAMCKATTHMIVALEAYDPSTLATLGEVNIILPLAMWTWANTTAHSDGMSVLDVLSSHWTRFKIVRGE